MELLAFIIGLMIMGPIVYLYFLFQDLKKRIFKIEQTLIINKQSVPVAQQDRAPDS